MKSKKIIGGVLALFVLGAAMSSVSDTQPEQQPQQAEAISVAEPVVEPVVESVVEPVAEPVAETVEETVVEPFQEAVQEPAQELTSAETMRLYAPTVMANAGYPMSATGEYVWSTVDPEMFDTVGYPVCESVELIGFELTALSIYEETAAMVSAYDIEPGPGSVGAMLGTFVGAYCPDSM